MNNQEFSELIKKNLSTNGFPAKKVALPLEKLYESADNKGLNLNSILEDLEKENIFNHKEEDKIVFFQKETSTFDPSSISPEMLQKAQEEMAKMDPEELKKMKDMFMNMSDEERQNLLKQAQSMFGQSK